MLKKILRKIIPQSLINYYKNYLKKYQKISYSQCGEDLIILGLIKTFNKNELLYLDIGAFHPYRFSNTALYYKFGWRGINIEPNPDLYKIFIKKRDRDINLNIGIAENNGYLDYYFLSEPTLNTFSKKEADKYTNKHAFKITNIKKISVDKINNILKKYNQGVFPPFLNLDTEGTEIEILQTIDFENNGPKIICVEFMEYGGFKNENKNIAVINYLLEKSYVIYGQTGINTLFVNKNWLGK